MRADELVELHGVDGIVGVRASGDDLERLELAAIHHRELGTAVVLLGLARTTPAPRDTCHAGNLEQDIGSGLEVISVFEDDEEMARDATDLLELKSNERRLHVAEETVLE